MNKENNDQNCDTSESIAFTSDSMLYESDYDMFASDSDDDFLPSPTPEKNPRQALRPKCLQVHDSPRHCRYDCHKLSDKDSLVSSVKAM